MVRSARALWFATLTVLLGLVPVTGLADPPAERAVEAAGGEVRNGFTPLHLAAMHGDLTQVKRILDAGHGADPSQAVYRGTPLQYAAARGRVEVVRELLRREATVDAVDWNGRTPLIWASMQGQTEVVHLLLDAGANIGAANDGGWTPLHYAFSRGHEKTAAALIERGASQELLNGLGQTPLDVKGANAGK